MTDNTNGLTPADKELWQAAFLSVLPKAIEARGWTMGNKALTSGEDRVNLAAIWADYAVLESRARFDAQACLAPLPT